MRWILLALISLQVASCGQKGPLYLPEPGAWASAGTAWTIGRQSCG